MNYLRTIAAAGCLLLSTPALCQNVFEGTWRPDPQKPGPGAAPETIELSQGMYACKSCTPAYQVRADGSDQRIDGNPRYDTLAIAVIDAHTVRKTAKKDGRQVLASTVVLAADGATRTETQTVTGMAPRPFDFAIRSQRVAPGAPGSHAVSGSWQVIEADLVNHDEDTTYLIVDGKLHMSDRLGRSFVTALDGSEAPYRGDPKYTSVSVRLINPNTLEETDKNGDHVVLVTRWTVGPDGRTMHASFDDTHGHVMEQSGHKLP